MHTAPAQKHCACGVFTAGSVAAIAAAATAAAAATYAYAAAAYTAAAVRTAHDANPLQIHLVPHYLIVPLLVRRDI
eukprot:16412-Heterococcus_DN1.PRE.1